MTGQIGLVQVGGYVGETYRSTDPGTATATVRPDCQRQSWKKQRATTSWFAVEKGMEGRVKVRSGP